jgi:hypothetical protein
LGKKPITKKGWWNGSRYTLCSNPSTGKKKKKKERKEKENWGNTVFPKLVTEED